MKEGAASGIKPVSSDAAAMASASGAVEDVVLAHPVNNKAVNVTAAGIIYLALSFVFPDFFRAVKFFPFIIMHPPCRFKKSLKQKYDLGNACFQYTEKTGENTVPWI